jgi:hypothetical protein
VASAAGPYVEHLASRHGQGTLLDGRHLVQRSEQLFYRDFIFIKL